jgi:hypothetical protein
VAVAIAKMGKEGVSRSGWCEAAAVAAATQVLGRAGAGGVCALQEMGATVHTPAHALGSVKTCRAAPRRVACPVARASPCKAGSPTSSTTETKSAIHGGGAGATDATLSVRGTSRGNSASVSRTSHVSRQERARRPEHPCLHIVRGSLRACLTGPYFFAP